MRPEQLTGAAAPPETLPQGGRLWRAYAQRLARLPGDTARLLLLLAADPDLDMLTLVRATEPECALTVLEPAERAGVIVRVAGDRYDFRERAMRPVVYTGASLARRRAAHRLLAGVLEHDHQRLRRAWHRAAALDGSGERLADELAAAAAAAAGSHGGHPAPSWPSNGRPSSPPTVTSGPRAWPPPPTAPGRPVCRSAPGRCSPACTP
ncbi:hypothetical protein ACFQX6_18765 [Streptosporangium lutulentum]